MSTTHYDIIKAPNAAVLAVNVTAAIASGWQPSGIPFALPEGEIMVTGNMLGQAVIKSDAVGVGEAAEGILATEAGDSFHRVTTLALDEFAVGDSADNASLALGAAIYTFPAGDIIVKASRIAVGVTIDDAVQTDTPEIGLGTVVASGANATLGAAPAGSENIFEGTAMADVAGTVFTGVKAPTGAAFLLIAAADDHDVYLNLADGWANLTAAAALTATGEITLEWLRLTSS